MFKNFINSLVIDLNILLLINGLVNGQKISGVNETDLKRKEFSSDSLCTSHKIDAVLNYRNGTIFAFKGNYFWEILNPIKPPIFSNAKLISHYWRVSSKNSKLNIFSGPIDAVFKDGNGFTYFFKRNKVFAFKEFSFIDSQIVPTFDSINSALLVTGMKDNESNVYIFKGNNYWQIFPMRKRYDFSEISSLYKMQAIEKMSPDFPTNIDTAFQDNHKNIIIVKGSQYIKIPVHDFPHSIKYNDLIPKFIFDDILYCQKSLYEKTSFSSYDEFLVKLILHNFGHQKDVTPKIEYLEKTCPQNSRFWFYIIIGTVIGFGLTVLLQYLFAISKSFRSDSFSGRNVLNTSSKVRIPQKGFESVDLIRKNQISAEI